MASLTLWQAWLGATFRLSSRGRACITLPNPVSGSPRGRGSSFQAPGGSAQALLAVPGSPRPPQAVRLQNSFEDAVAAARRGIADRMAAQLAENIRHEGCKSAKSRLGDVLGSMEAGSRRGDYDREARAWSAAAPSGTRRRACSTP